MNSSDFAAEIDYVGSNGIILTLEQKAALQTSLCLLEDSQKLNISFWGKINTTGEDDYFIAQGTGENGLGERKTFYSKNCIHWKFLTPVSKEVKESCRLARGPFRGDLSHEFSYQVHKRAGVDASDEEETVTVTEESRLAAMIEDIDFEVKIVPRSAYVMKMTGNVCTNKKFEGLSVVEASKLCNYMHFRRERLLPNVLRRATYDKSMDFMDNIEDDIPRGSWSLQLDRGSGLVILRSLYWLGYVFYHVPGTRKFGSLYWGDGERNVDLPFML